MNIDYALSDITRQFDAATFQRGRAYAQSGMVQSASREGAGIAGKVKGSARNSYRQEIAVVAGRDGVRFKGACSCPMEHNCKHVVAVLLEFQRLAQDASAASREGGAPAPNWLVSEWLERVGRVLSQAPFNAALAAAAEAAPKGPYRLVYVLCPNKSGRGLDLLVCKGRLNKDGVIGAASVMGETHSLLSYPPDFVRPSDAHAVRLFVALRSGGEWGSACVEPEGALGAQLLLLLADSQRLYWSDSRAELKGTALRPLARGASRAGALAWRDAPATPGRQSLGWQFDDGAPLHHMVHTDPVLYVRDGVLGELQLDPGLAAIPLREWRALLEAAPPLAPADVVAMPAALAKRGLDKLVPAPKAPRQTRRSGVMAQPFLLLGSMGGAAADPDQADDFAVIAFDYAGQRVSADPAQQLLRVTAEGSEVTVRDAAAEAHAHAALEALGFHSARHPVLRSMHGALELSTQQRWRDFARHDLAGLRLRGWLIELAPSYRHDVREVDEWYADVAEGGEGQGWFGLELGIVLGERRVPLLPLLVRLIAEAPDNFAPAALAARADDEQLIVRLDDGTRVALAWSRLRPILQTLGELYFSDRVGDGLRLPELDAARLAELEAGAQLRWLGGERLRALGAKLARFGGIAPVAPPSGLRASLRPYQLEGVAWMQFLREYGLAGILADDMGLGKTIQTLAHILTEKEAGRLDAPALVVAPTSLMSNWQAEAARFAPGLSVLLLHGPERQVHFDDIGRYDLVLTTYALLPRDEAALRRQRFHLLVLDESQYIKNHRAQAAQTAVLLQARHRLCLTGTPLQNHLGELWSQFHFLLPGLLGDEKSFNRDFRKPIEKLGDSQRNGLLTQRIKPFLLRRTKDVVATELPAKTEIVRQVELAGQQRDLYETVRVAMDKKVRDEIAKKGVARSQIVILDALLKLRQVCCDPRLVKRAGAKGGAPSAKLEALLEMVQELLEEGRKILVFSQFTSMLALIEEQLRQRRIGYALLTGDTIDRGAQVDAFQRGAVPVFLISLKAGGVGLNLTAADTVIHYDPWWNPAAENQATDRAWRIGQDKPVFVYKLIAKGTLEEKIQALQRDKAALADAVLSEGASAPLSMTQDDLRSIFAPL